MWPQTVAFVMRLPAATTLVLLLAICPSRTARAGGRSAAACEALGNATCYYIDATRGHAANTGRSPDSPWPNFANLMSYEYEQYKPKTWTQVGPGDVIYLMPGVHNTCLPPGDDPQKGGASGGTPHIAYFRSNSSGGAEGNPITIKPLRSPSSQEPVVLGDAPCDGITLLETRHWVVDGIEVRGAGGWGVDLEGCMDCNVSRCVVHDNARLVDGGNPTGVMMRGSSGIVSNSVLFDNFEHPVKDFTRGDGVHIFGEGGGNITIFNNTFLNTKNATDKDGNPMGFGGGTMYKHAGTDPTQYFHVHRNRFINVGTASTSGVSFGSGTANTWFHHNLIINSHQPLESKDFGGTTRQINQLFEFNTLYQTAHIGIDAPGNYTLSSQFPTHVHNLTFRNNVVYVWDTQPPDGPVGLVLDAVRYSAATEYSWVVPQLHTAENCYFSAGGSTPQVGLAAGKRAGNKVPSGTFGLPQWQTQFHQDHESVVADPLFLKPGVTVNGTDFRMQVGSKCTSMGIYGDQQEPSVHAANIAAPRTAYMFVCTAECNSTDLMSDYQAHAADITGIILYTFEMVNNSLVPNPNRGFPPDQCTAHMPQWKAIAPIFAAVNVKSPSATWASPTTEQKFIDDAVSTARKLGLSGYNMDHEGSAHGPPEYFSFLRCADPLHTASL